MQSAVNISLTEDRVMLSVSEVSKSVSQGKVLYRDATHLKEYSIFGSDTKYERDGEGRFCFKRCILIQK